MATTKEIKNWEWIKSVEVQYMGFLTQRIRDLMEEFIDPEPTSLLKEYHIHLNAQPKEGQENPSITQKYQRN